MNRALGFGIAAAGGLPLLVTGATPAAAHSVSLQSDQGTVTVLTGIGPPARHHALLVHDRVAGDGTLVRGEYTLIDGTKGGITAPHGGLVQTPSFPPSNEITAMRKCQAVVPSGWQCSAWTGV